MDIFNSQLLLLIALADTTELYKIEKIVQVEKNGINSNPLSNTSNKG